MLTQVAHQRIGKRYQIIHPLGKGGMGVVYRALDRLTGHTVALKRVLATAGDLMFSTRASSGGLADLNLALAHEFKILASLRHPNIISVLDYGFDQAQQPYFTMDLLENPQTILEAGQGQPFDDQIELLVQILQALAYLHRQGILHRDLKPSNILVENGQVRVLDFGLSITREQRNASTSGTIAYMAPEIFSGEITTERSDLYALGVIAYELLMGRYPYTNTDLMSLIDEIENTTPDLQALAETQPEIAVILQKLLAKKPADRFASANDVIAEFSAATNRPFTNESAATRESLLKASRFVGRNAELDQLTSVIDQGINGSGSAWLVGGESGVGKSRLFSELRTIALVKGVIVLRGQAISEGGLAYQLWRDIVRWLAIASEPSSFEASILKPLLPDIDSLLEATIPDAPPLNPQAAQTRFFGTVVDLLKRQEQPTLLILEDIQWCGDESLALLHWVNRATNEQPLMVMANYRDDEKPDLPAQLPEMSALTMHRLSSENISELSESILGSAGRNPAVIELLNHETEGNAFFVIEVVRSLAESAGQLDRVGMTTLPAAVFAGEMRRIIERRLEHIDPADLEILRLAAVIGRRLNMRVLKAALPNVALESWRMRCYEARIFEIQEAVWQFAHDKLREGALLGLNPEQRRLLHERAALAIEAVYSDDESQAAILAYHWRMAQNTEKEGHYAAIAGEQTAARYANDEAITFLSRTLELKPDQPRPMLRLGEVWQLVGKWTDAEALFRKGLALAQQSDDAYWQARFTFALGNLFFLRGHLEQAIPPLEEAQRQFEALDDRGHLSRTFGILGNTHIDLCDFRRAEDYLNRATDMALSLNDQKNASYMIGLLGINYLDEGDYPRALEKLEQWLQSSEQTGDKFSLRRALANIALIKEVNGDYQAALTLMDRSLRLALEFGDQQYIGKIFTGLGCIYIYTDEFEAALRCLLYGLQNALDLGDLKTIGMTLAHIAPAYSQRAKYEIAERVHRQTVRLCDAINLYYYGYEARATGAEMLTTQERYAEALDWTRQALEMIRTRNGRPEILNDMLVLEVYLQAELGEIDLEVAAGQYQTLLEGFNAAKDQAAVHYYLWLLNQSDDELQAAADLYHDLYTQTATTIYGKRYTQLTGKTLPVPFVLPQPEALNPLAEKILIEARKIAATLDPLLERVDQILATL